MSRTAAVRAATGADRPTAASVLALLQSIERVGSDAPAAIAFKGALASKGREADAAGGVPVLDELLRAVALSDPEKASARTAIVRAAWVDLMPVPGGGRP